MRPADLNDVRLIGRHLRESDRREVEAGGLRPEDAVMLSFCSSDICLTGCVDGEPTMIFGVGCPLLSDTGEIWALGTDTCDRVPVAMVKVGRAAVKQFLEIYPALENFCSAEYKKALRWLKMIGFTLGEPEPFGPKGAPFCRLFIQRGEV